jgi:CRP-like cAMP-binding protein
MKNLYIFEGFSEAEVAYFLLMSQTQYRKIGETIIHEAEQSNGCAYYVNRWVVKVTQSGKELANLGPGSFFGEIALITDEPRTATVEALEETELQVFMKDDFLTLLRRSVHSEEMRTEVMRRIKERVKH